MTFHVFSPQLERLGQISSYKRAEWYEEYQGFGGFLCHLDSNDRNAKLSQKGNFFFRQDRGQAVRIFAREVDEETNTIILGGYNSISLLGFRGIIDRTRITNVEQGIYSLVGGNLRNLPVTLDSPKGFLYVHDTQFTLKEMEESLKTLCAKSGLGIKMEFNADDQDRPYHFFTVYDGEDRTYDNGGMVFSDKFGTLTNFKISEDDTDFCNVAYVAGEGEWPDRRIVTVGTAVGIDRRELIVDARDLRREDYSSSTAYDRALVSRGTEKLAEKIEKQTFEGTVKSNEFWLTHGLGTKITCLSERYGITFDTRIAAYRHKDILGKESHIISLGEPRLKQIKGVV